MTSDSDSDMDMGEGMGEAGDVDIVDAAWWAEQQRIRGFVSPMKEDADRDFSWMCSNCTFQNAAGMWQCEMCSKKALQRVQNLKRRCFVRLTIAGA